MRLTRGNRQAKAMESTRSARGGRADSNGPLSACANRVQGGVLASEPTSTGCQGTVNPLTRGAVASALASFRTVRTAEISSDGSDQALSWRSRRGCAEEPAGSHGGNRAVCCPPRVLSRLVGQSRDRFATMCSLMGENKMALEPYRQICMKEKRSPRPLHSSAVRGVYVPGIIGAYGCSSLAANLTKAIQWTKIAAVSASLERRGCEAAPIEGPPNEESMTTSPSSPGPLQHAACEISQCGAMRGTTSPRVGAVGRSLREVDHGVVEAWQRLSTAKQALPAGIVKDEVLLLPSDGESRTIPSTSTASPHQGADSPAASTLANYLIERLTRPLRRLHPLRQANQPGGRFLGDELGRRVHRAPHGVELRGGLLAVPGYFDWEKQTRSNVGVGESSARRRQVQELRRRPSAGAFFVCGMERELPVCTERPAAIATRRRQRNDLFEGKSGSLLSRFPVTRGQRSSFPTLNPEIDVKKDGGRRASGGIRTTPGPCQCRENQIHNAAWGPSKAVATARRESVSPAGPGGVIE